MPRGILELKVLMIYWKVPPRPLIMQEKQEILKKREVLKRHLKISII